MSVQELKAKFEKMNMNHNPAPPVPTFKKKDNPQNVEAKHPPPKEAK